MGAGLGNQIDAGLLCGLHEHLDVENALCREMPRLPLQKSPVDIEADGVEAEGFDLLKDIDP
jgi:hypothetical protein